MSVPTPFKTKPMIACGYEHTVLLRDDGTCIATGNNVDGRCNVSEWKYIVQVVCGTHFTVGLDAYGGVYLAGIVPGFSQEDLSCAKKLVCGAHHIVAFKRIIGVMACGSNEYGESNVLGVPYIPGIHDVKDICCSDNHTVVLFEDGTVFACGRNLDGECNVKRWKNVRSISCANGCTVGVTNKNTVLYAGSNKYKQNKIEKQNDVRAVVCAPAYCYALTRDDKAIRYGDVTISEFEGYASFRGIKAYGLLAVGQKTDGTLSFAGASSAVSKAFASRKYIDYDVSFEFAAAIAEDGTVYAAGENAHEQCNVGGWNAFVWKDKVREIVDSAEHICTPMAAVSILNLLVLRADGSVGVYGCYDPYGILEAGEWNGAVAIAVSMRHAVCIMKDGRVDAVGNNEFGQCNVETWTDIVQVACNLSCTVGVKRDGTVVSAGFGAWVNRDKWTDIVQVACGDDYTVGLKRDGTVIAGKYEPSSACDVDGWTDIVQISCGKSHTVGLKRDGTVVACGKNDDEQCNVGEFKDIVQISCGDNFTMGLKKDGTVVFAGDAKNRREAYFSLFIKDHSAGNLFHGNWSDLVYIACGGSNAVGIRRDGSVVYYGENHRSEALVATDYVGAADGAKAEEEARRIAEEKIRAEADAEMFMAELVRKKAEEEESLKAEEEARLKAEEAALQEALKLANELALNQERQREEAEALEATRREFERMQAELAEERRRLEEERAKIEEEKRLREEAEDEAKRIEEEKRRAEEEKRRKEEEAARIRAEEEARLKAEEEARLKAEEEKRLAELIAKTVEYTKSPDGSYYTVTGMGESTRPDVEIFSEYQGLPVREIAEDAFKDQVSITSVTVPDSVKVIGIGAFDGCTSLQSVRLSAGLVRIEDYTFNSCTALEDISIPDSVSEIGAFAFYGCGSLSAVTLPHVSLIGESAFHGCRALGAVDLGASLETVGQNAFAECATLKSVLLPRGVLSVEYAAFRGCTALESLSLPASIYNIGSYAFDGCTSLTSLELEDGIRTLGVSTFSGCTSLKEVVVPDGVEILEDYVFYGCEGLRRVSLPDGLTEIGEYAFGDCVALEEILFRGASHRWNAVRKRAGWKSGTRSVRERIAGAR